jgi:MFS transporter, DHA2 family, multidrug resistance protein
MAEGAATPGQAREWKSPHNKWIVAGTVLTGTIMAVLDSSIVNVALPEMQGTLGATVDQITWVVTGYILSNVIVMPIVGMLSSRLGRKNFFMGSVLLFTAASMACGLSRTLPEMVLFRILQGVGGGVVITVPQAILLETFPVQEQGVAMGMYGMGVVLAPAVGPLVGGWLTDHYSWPWIFFINVPIGVLNILLVTRFIEDPPYLVRQTGRIDWTGLALMTVGLGALQLMLEEGQRNNWFSSSYIVWLGAVAAVGLIFFIIQELRTHRPAVDLRILKNPAFTSATAIGAVLGAGLYGVLFLLPLFLQNLLGYPAFKSGLALMPRGLAMAVIMPIGGRFYNRLGPKLLVGLGLVVSAFSFWELSHLSLQIGFWDIFWPQVWQGVGFSLIFVALSTAALATVPKPEMTAASGLYNVVRRLFGSVGIAVAATQVTAGTVRYGQIIGTHVTAYNETTRLWLQHVLGGMVAAGSNRYSATMRALDLLHLDILRQAAVLAYNHVFALVMAVFVASVPLVFFLRSATGGADREIALD